MYTAAYKVDAPSDRRRRGNEPRHILCAIAGWKGKTMELFWADVIREKGICIKASPGM